MVRYGRIVSERYEEAPGNKVVDGVMIFNFNQNEELMKATGYLPVVEDEVPSGYMIADRHYSWDNEAIYEHYTLTEMPEEIEPEIEEEELRPEIEDEFVDEMMPFDKEVQ